MADEQAANPALRQSLIAEVIADLAVDADGADASVGFEGKEKVRAGGHDAAGNAAGWVFQGELRVGGEAEVDKGLGVGLRRGR